MQWSPMKVTFAATALALALGSVPTLAYHSHHHRGQQADRPNVNMVRTERVHALMTDEHVRKTHAYYGGYVGGPRAFYRGGYRGGYYGGGYRAAYRGGYYGGGYRTAVYGGGYGASYGGCGGCGAAAVYAAPAPVYGGCGGCGAAVYAPRAVYAAPVYSPPIVDVAPVYTSVYGGAIGPGCDPCADAVYEGF